MTQQTMEQREQSQACLRSATKETLDLSKNGKKILVLAGKSAPKIIREDPICELAVC